MKTDPFAEELEIAVRACPGLIFIGTVEEDRALEAVQVVGAQLRRPVRSFDIVQGWSPQAGGNGSPSTTNDPAAALQLIATADGDGLYVLKDPQDWWGNPAVKRTLRTVAQQLKYSRKCIICLCPDVTKLPKELQDPANLLVLPPPTTAELSAVLDHLSRSPGATVDLTAAERKQLLQNALGLTVSQAQFVFARVLVLNQMRGPEAIELVAQEKARILATSQALQFYPVTQTPESVGGLELLKDWLRLRLHAFTPEGRDYGLPLPKGLALIGIPGTGKSLTAKRVAGMYRMPLLRLNMGAIFGSLVGDSEANLRRALQQSEAIAPVVLWADEMEKGLAQGDHDGGTSKRVFGDFLTWMQEKTAPVFVVATCNNINAVPPELMRKGRFDEVFFLDLPTFVERRAIFEVHLRKRRRQTEAFDLDRLARESQGWVGSEIEQAIVEAMHVAFADHQREFTTEDIVAAIRNQKPLSKFHAEAIARLRELVQEGRVRPASPPEAPEAG